jgi:HYR domain
MRRIAFLVAVVSALAIAVTYGASAAPPPISIDVTSPVEATDSAGADVTFSVRVRTGVDATCTPTGGPGQSFAATAHLPLGDSTITCSDGTNTATATVTVRDTTPPVVQVPAGAGGAANNPSGTAVVTWDPVSATDSVDGTLTATCSPPSGSSFSVGQTTVTCSATDSHGNTGVGTFVVNVTFSDTTPPTLSVPGPLTAEATSAAGAIVAYSVSATDDNSGAPPTVSCDHPSGSTFPLGQTTVTCTASDAAGNTSAAQSFPVTVQDTTPPSLELPGNITAEADSAAGKVITYSAGATDAVSGSLPVTCTPASGSTFPLGTTSVSCSATDGAGKTASGSFTVTVTDSTAPTFVGLSADRQIEANGPAGSVVNYTLPTATDASDGPEVVTCSPTSGSTFPLGTTVVTCSASDSHGNVGTASFSVRIVDTTKPTLVVPADRAVYANTPDGISAQSADVSTFLAEAQASDTVDPSPRVSNNAPGFLGIGVQTITFTATDASGNAASQTARLDVRPMPPPGSTPPPLPTPPARTVPKDVTNLKAEPGDGVIRLSWKVPAGVDHVVVTRRLSAGGDTNVVYTGSAESYVDRGVVNGLEYRYLVVSVDKSGSASAGVAVTALPKATLLRSPKDGAKLKKPPRLVWVRNAEASYYNVQLFRGETKILSMWPTKTQLTLQRRWKYQKRAYVLSPGSYRWYVWPGFGARAAVDYGELLGFSSFTIVR